DADTAVKRCNAGHAYKDALARQRLKQGAGKGAIAAAVDGDKIRGRRQGAQPVVSCNPGDPGTGRGGLGLHMAQPVLILQRGKSTNLGGSADAEMVAD